MKKFNASAAFLLSVMVLSCNKERDSNMESQIEIQTQEKNEQHLEATDSVFKPEINLSPSTEMKVSTSAPWTIPIKPNLKITAPPRAQATLLTP